MKHLLVIFSLLFVAQLTFGQSETYVKGSGIRYDRGTPTVAPGDTSVSTEFLIDLANMSQYQWDRLIEAWVKQFNVRRGNGAPAGDPGNGPEWYVDNSTRFIYWWSGAGWLDINRIPSGTEISITPSGNLSSTNAQAALEELQAQIDGISAGTVPDGDKGDLTVSSGDWQLDQDAQVLTYSTTRNELYSSNAGAGQYWGDYDNFINGRDRFPVSITVLANGAGTIRLAYLSLESSTATLLKTDDYPVVSGSNVLIPDTTGLSLGSERVYVALAQVSGNVVSYASVSPNGNAYFVNTSTLVITNTSSFEFGYTIQWRHQQGLLKGLHDLQTEMEGLLDQVDQKVDSLAVFTGSYPAGTAFSHTLLNDLLNTYEIVTLPADTITITGTINVPAGKTLRGLGQSSVIKTTQSSINCIQPAGDGVTLRDFSIMGTAAFDYQSTNDIAGPDSIENRINMGNQVGIYITGSRDIVIEKVHYYQLDGAGLRINNSVGTFFSGAATVSDCVFDQNYIGVDLYQVGEYNNFSNLKLYRNVIGIWNESGNNTFDNMTIVSNRVGIVIADRGATGSNNSHGSFSNSTINHNEYIGIYGFDFDYQFSFSNCQLWATTSGIGVRMQDCIGFTWLGGFVSRDLFFLGSGWAKIHSATHSTANTFTTSGTASVDLKLNHKLDGTTAGVNN